MADLSLMNSPHLPKQSAYIGRAASIAPTLGRAAAVMIRDDLEAPFLALFRLEDGFIVTSEECEYELVPVTEGEGNAIDDESPPREKP